MKIERTRNMSTQSPRQRAILAAAVIVALAVISVGLFGIYGKNVVAAPSTQPEATPVSVATVVESDVAAWDEFSGRLEAVERVDVRSRVAGAVQSAHFAEGALVRKGDLLVTIDP